MFESLKREKKKEKNEMKQKKPNEPDDPQREVCTSVGGGEKKKLP